MDKNSQIDALIMSLLTTLPIRSKSLLVSVWGDSISPRGGTVWLGNLITIMAPFNINDRAVRTSVFRLQQENILSSVQKGRRSYYSLTDYGKHVFEDATGRIYSSEQPDWTGEWSLLFPEFCKSEKDKRQTLWQELQWQGYGQINNSVFAKPVMITRAQDHMNGVTAGKPVLQMIARRLPTSALESEKQFLHRMWDLDDVQTGYQQFIDHFTPVLKLLDNNHRINDCSSFFLRSLIVHDFRRILLRAPVLPESLLPDNWKGHTAKSLFTDIYRKIWFAAETHLDGCLNSDSETTPDATDEFYARFGGLNQQE